MQVISPPKEWTGNGSSLFLAGGISNCPDWQSEVIELLADTNLMLLNPRRPSYPWDDPTAADEQIRWEFGQLRRASAILFWFPWETLCPIALYELGAWSMTQTPLFVGTHPDYQRRLDVQIQTQLVRPTLAVVASLAELSEQVHVWQK